MLKDAASSPTPTKYVQKRCPGMYLGTNSAMNFADVKCSAPNAANGTAKHRFARATVLSRPRARAIPLPAATMPIRKQITPATDIQSTVGSVCDSRNVAVQIPSNGLMRCIQALQSSTADFRKLRSVDCTAQDWPAKWSARNQVSGQSDHSQILSSDQGYDGSRSRIRKCDSK